MERRPGVPPPLVNPAKLAVVALASAGLFIYLYVHTWRLVRAEQKTLATPDSVVS